MPKKATIIAKWGQAIRIALALTATLIITFLVFKAGFSFGYQTGLRQMMPPVQQYKTVIPYSEQHRKDI